MSVQIEITDELAATIMRRANQIRRRAEKPTDTSKNYREALVVVLRNDKVFSREFTDMGADWPEGAE